MGKIREEVRGCNIDDKGKGRLIEDGITMIQKEQDQLIEDGVTSKLVDIYNIKTSITHGMKKSTA